MGPRNLLTSAKAHRVCAVLACLLLGASAPCRSPGPALKLDQYELTFDEPFNTLDVSPRGPGTRWIAHTPWNGDFGDATFIDPRPNEPFRTVGGILEIEMRRRGDRWESGLLASADRFSNGFVQSGGYFEIRAKLPGGPGVWPAFWLGSNAVSGLPTPEIDVLEYYGAFSASYLATTHTWQDGKSIGGQFYKVYVPKSSLENAYHTYGVSIDAKNVIFYLDRREVAREATKPEYLKPMYPMVNLAAGGGWPIDGMQSPSIMYVDYVRAYKLKR